MITILLPWSALTTVFDECDRFDNLETGGALIGCYSTSLILGLTIEVRGIIGAGPKARRTPVSFFKDGDYQERIFRQVEKKHPAINHLGSWHTHHPNGLKELSHGDVETYHKNVNSPNHAIDFYYALLVTERVANFSGLRGRYKIKHYVFRRGEKAFYQVPAGNVEITKAQLLL